MHFQINHENKNDFLKRKSYYDEENNKKIDHRLARAMKPNMMLVLVPPLKIK